MSLVTWQNQAVVPSFTPGPLCTVDGEKIPVEEEKKVHWEAKKETVGR